MVESAVSSTAKSIPTRRACPRYCSAGRRGAAAAIVAVALRAPALLPERLDQTVGAAGLICALQPDMHRFLISAHNLPARLR
jgi:hypothetical protein